MKLLKHSLLWPDAPAYEAATKLNNCLARLPAIAIQQHLGSTNSAVLPQTGLNSVIVGTRSLTHSESLVSWNASLLRLPPRRNDFDRRLSTFRNSEWTDKRDRMLVIQPRISPRWLLKSRLQEAIRLADSLVSPPTNKSGGMAGKIGRQDGATPGPSMSPGVVGRDGGNPWLIVRGQRINRRSEGKGQRGESDRESSVRSSREETASRSRESGCGVPGWQQGSSGSSSQAGEVETMVVSATFHFIME